MTRRVGPARWVSPSQRQYDSYVAGKVAELVAAHVEHRPTRRTYVVKCLLCGTESEPLLAPPTAIREKCPTCRGRLYVEEAP